MDVKKAIIFLKEEIKKLGENQKKEKHRFKFAQREVQRMFLNLDYKPYSTWFWVKETADGKKHYCIYGDKEAVLQSNCGEPEVKYLWRLHLWQEFVKITGYDYLPTVFWGDAWEITCHHILLNKLCGGKPHLPEEKEKPYVDSEYYKTLLERIEKQFPLSQEAQGGNHATE